MTGSNNLILALCMFCGLQTSVHAQPRQDKPRGELLYATHCNGCHTLKIHWRYQKLATDWISLKALVHRWQASIGQSWSEEEIEEVAEYLNATHYNFPVTDLKELSKDEKSEQFLIH